MLHIEEQSVISVGSPGQEDPVSVPLVQSLFLKTFVSGSQSAAPTQGVQGPQVNQKNSRTKRKENHKNPRMEWEAATKQKMLQETRAPDCSCY